MMNRRRRTGPRARRGFSLVEVIMAMTLLSVVLLSLAKMGMTLSTRNRLNDMVAKRNAVLVQEANKFNAMPFDSLATISTADKVWTFGDFKFTRQITITTTTSTQKAVKIRIIPYVYSTKKDSVTVYRTKPPGSPLCVGC